MSSTHDTSLGVVDTNGVSLDAIGEVVWKAHAVSHKDIGLTAVVVAARSLVDDVGILTDPIAVVAVVGVVVALNINEGLSVGIEAVSGVKEASLLGVPSQR